ncbi:MAG: copper ion binding protein [Treponema sp.]|jgi:copper chaperone|nr:copper ion binding protein [Treponema sp.]
MEKKTLKVEGMSCEHCVKAVNNAVSALPGLADVSVDLKGGTVSFNYDPAKTPLETVQAAIVDAGYEAHS